MTSKTTNRFSPEVRTRAVCLVLHQEGEHTSRWAAIDSSPRGPASTMRIFSSAECCLRARRRISLIVRFGPESVQFRSPCANKARISSRAGMEGAVPARVTEIPAAAQPKRTASTGSAPAARAVAKAP